MARVDKLLTRAKHLSRAFYAHLSLDSEFITALGLNPLQYAEVRPDGVTVYDDNKALFNQAASDWSGSDDLEAVEAAPAVYEWLEDDAEQEQEEEPLRDHLTVVELQNARSALTSNELGELLKVMPVMIGSEKRFITPEEASKYKEAVQDGPKTYNGSPHDLFGWG